MKKFILLLFAINAFAYGAKAQGCIALRNLTGFGQFSIPQYNEEPVKWLVGVNSRYSEFNDTYRGSDNLNVPPEDQTFSRTVIVDFTVARIYDNGWSIAVDIPIMSASRKNWQDHTLPSDSIKVKHTTNSFGLSDIRISVYKWLLDVTKPHKGNIQVGLGLKFATGDYRYQDYLYRAAPAGRTVGPVNLTLHPGDGGTGITTELNTFYTLNSTISVYANGFYLFNPRDQNGTSATNGRTPPADLKEAGGDVISVPDAFLVRGGANVTIRDLVFWGGIRFEGAPVYDAFGSSNGLRRAGYVVSAEPGINYTLKKATIFAFLPITIYKTTKQTVPDKAISNSTGIYTPSPGGIADSMLFLGALFRI